MSEQGYWVLLTEAEWQDLAEQCSPAWQMRIAQILEPVEILAARNARAARDAWAARAAFYPALSEYVIALVQQLEPAP